MNTDHMRVVKREGVTEAGAPVVASRVSVIVPTRNSSKTLDACLASVRAQTFHDIELIVVDNHSNDATVEIATRYADSMSVTGPERSTQRNVGAKLSTGEFLLFVDSDMLLSPRVAEEVAQAFREHPRAQALVIPERSVGVGFWAQCRALEKELYLGDPDVESARAFRRSAFEVVGGYDERLHAGEDWDLSKRVAATVEAIGRVTSPLFHDEGRLTLRRDLAKKLYYGRSLGRYVRKHPRHATRKLVRPAFIRKLPLLAGDPAHAVGLVLLKTLELGAAGTGLVTGWFRRHLG